ncbi:MAG: bifunctional diaminohydroxyphosphoribosylaminopyrimidine deaminase/5-amino-6-(5-phosphoribosylamino)uracil reductase RibD [Fimbriimonadaceae bacterium]|nr:bifunctional diaminohydroxyphosphoribosylaminopyrimidine deaminase/5-amino-6-(5-phosphoribosylamino)uracil reductase RibD [Fimbriimonadaceae bacterium]QYK55848.1 MAG: bifunctional diaminohydroxyphosphoribosylaminopyrimidine deaminase/5-amino-6-(5-phosphoribosylamino)uracil reductase RibD [Fimbriimonadaceae bacterium]
MTAAERFMAEAVGLSRRGYPAPNPHVGCVVVKDGVVVGRGWHEAAGQPHAEAVALAEAGAQARGADLFVTLEPCAHHGRTPPCAEAVVRAGVARVWFAIGDPNPRAAGGAQTLRAAGVEVHEGLGAAEAEAANVVFLTAQRSRRPYVCLKAAVTLDGFMARPDGESKWITGEEARREARLLRAEMGSVMVGWKTVARDDPRLTVREPEVRNEPLRIVLDPHAELSGEEALFREEGPVLWLVEPGGARDARQTEVAMDAPSILARVLEAGAVGVLIEGGPQTIRRFAEAGTWDRLELFLGARTFGGGLRLELPGELNLNLATAQRIGPDIRCTYVRRHESAQFF